MKESINKRAKEKIEKTNKARSVQMKEKAR